jgi:hypothetical protein
MKQPAFSQFPNPIELQIVSNTPGRLRLKVPSEYQQHQEINQIASNLEYIFPQIEEIKTNLDSVSITIYYNGGNKTLQDALSKLPASGINLVNAPAKKLQPVTITKTVLSLNEQIKQATKETVDMRSLLTFSILAFVIKRLLPQLARWQSTILYLLLWYAVESLVKMSDNQEQADK